MVAFDFFHLNVQFVKRGSISWVFLPAFQHDPVSNSQKKNHIKIPERKYFSGSAAALVALSYVTEILHSNFTVTIKLPVTLVYV